MLEMSVAGYGDFEPSTEMISTMSMIPLKKYWRHIGHLHTRSHKLLDIYKHKDGKYIVGSEITSTTDHTIFEVVLELKTTPQKSIQHRLKVSYPLHNIDLVVAAESERGYGIATQLYKYLVTSQHMSILGDEKQYIGARKLWIKLSNDKDVKVSLVDIDEDLVVHDDINIDFHGPDDHDFDENIWSYTDDNKHLRLILQNN